MSSTVERKSLYVPSHFAPDDEAVHDLLAHHGAADLVTATPVGLLATTLPMVYDRDRAELAGHVARNNEQWRHPVLGEALVIVRGPDSYVSPSWYAAKAEPGRVVPTWNYMVAHVHGTLAVHDDPGWLEAHVRRLTDLHESGLPAPWSVDDAPAGFVTGQLRAIVGITVAISRVEGKFKLSQNRTGADVDGVVRGLADRGDIAGAAAVRAHRGAR